MNFVIYNENGQIKTKMSCPDELFRYQIIPDGCNILDIGDQYIIDISEYYVLNKILTLLPIKPNQYSKFDYINKVWIDDNDLATFNIKKQRDNLLSETDWTDTASAPSRLGQTIYQQWQNYRQELRDIPSQSGYPFNVIWPTKPI